MALLTEIYSSAESVRSSGLLLAAILFITYYGYKVIYRLFLHPLAGFPGPTLAALTPLYEFYYDGILPAQYVFEVERMHKKYGPIIRIAPDELHVNEPAFLNELYVRTSKKRDKVPPFVALCGMPDAASATADHDRHRMRRGALNPFFSKAAVAANEDIVAKNVNLLCSQMEKYAGTKESFSLMMAINCYTADTVMEYSFAQSYSFLENIKFDRNFHRGIFGMMLIEPWLNVFPVIYYIQSSLPQWLLKKMSADMALFIDYQNDMKEQVDEVVRNRHTDKKHDHRVIFDDLVRGDMLPENEKSASRLWQEGQSIVGAGTETTAWTLSVIFYYVLSTPSILAKLDEEISKVMPDPALLPKSSKLEPLPYLISTPLHLSLSVTLTNKHSAVVSEGLRLSYGISKRVPELAPSTLILKDKNNGKEWEIPARTAISMTVTLIHHNEDLFPEPKAFVPDRWLDNRGLNRYLLSFNVGSRGCLGMNLAYSEMFLAVAAIVRRFGSRMKLHDTTEDNIQIDKAYFVPVPKKEKDIQVTIEAKA